MFVAYEQTPELAPPPRFPSPLQPGEPHPLAARAVAEMQAFIRTHPQLEGAHFYGELGGKMFGVLVVRDAAGTLGYLRGFAGMIGGRRMLEGFVPPLFDDEAFSAIWGPGGAEISALDQARKQASDPAQARALAETQSARSRVLHAQLHELYELRNARGERRSLRSLFEPHIPPGGAGDCAAPKLIARAYALGLQPVALAEFWWGRSPPAGGRQHGVYYPACRGRCSRILPFMLEGIECEPDPDVGMRVFGPELPRVIHEDEHIIVVDKPCGMLSVPGRGPRRRDSVEYRLQQRAAAKGDADAEADWPRLVHRLDLATSGLLIAGKHKPAYVALQRQFSAREVDKRYLALLRGCLSGDSGVVELPLSRDVHDRPRQKYCPERGKAASTRWEVLAREAELTRVALYPKTGRTHQLRLHAAHPRGLDAPIVGDLLYGYGDQPRLMLHAEGIGFVHPVTGESMQLRSPCPF